MLISSLRTFGFAFNSGVVEPQGRYSTGNIPTIAKKAAALVLGSLILWAMASVPRADAGPITYAACMAGLTAGTGGAGASFAWYTCLPFLGPWCP